MTDAVGRSLRPAALEALGPWADPRALRALTDGEIAFEPDVSSWDASSGPVRGHRIALRLDAQLASDLRDAPAVADALCAAIATAVSNTPGHALADFVVRSPKAEIGRRSPYRDAP